MLLTIDIGNSNINILCFDGDKTAFESKMFTSRHKADDEYATHILDIFSLYHVEISEIDDVVIASVVPEITGTLSVAIKKIFGKEPLLVGENFCGKMRCDALEIKYIGADLICGVCGAIAKYPLPCLVVDMGTATKILCIDADGKFLGCTIAPGIKISIDALADRASLLPTIDIHTPPQNIVGTDTVECMKSGIIYGNACMLDGMIERISTELNFKNPTVVATGGCSPAVVRCCKTNIIYDKNLVLSGMKAIFYSAFYSA